MVFLDLKTVNRPFEDELVEAATRVIRSGRYILGENVRQFESELAEFCEVSNVVAVSNGLDALRLILRAYIELGAMKPGDEIIVPADTYIASVLAISDNDLVPVFVDPDLLTMNLDTSIVEQHITKHTRGIMPVHLYGTPCWDSKLRDLALRYDLKIIEDNAQAIGARASVPGLNGTFTTGSLGHAGGISFYPTKNFGALGDAGAVTTNDKALADAVRALANYGSDRRYHNIYRGWNCRMDEIQAAMLRVKLKYVRQENERRAKIVETYNSNIYNKKITKPAIFHDMTQVWHQYVLRVENRDAFRAYMDENGIGTDVLYATPPHLQPCYVKYKTKQLPNTMSIANKVVCLPISSAVTESIAVEISEIVNNFQG